MSDHSITSLIEKLEGAEVGSRELGNLVLAATNPYKSGPYAHWHTAAMEFDWSNEITTSLDAALALAERVIKVRGPIELSIMGSCVATILSDDPCANGLGHAFGNTPALALCIAILRAQSEARV